MLSQAHKRDKEIARDILKTILSSLRYLARQGIAFRKANEVESNLIQLLKLRAEDNPAIDIWLKKSQRKYVSPENQNEILEIMASHVIRKILSFINN